MTKDVDPHVPKRDVVMHGREIDFGNERASIQLLLVLEVMHFCDPAARDEELRFRSRAGGRWFGMGEQSAETSRLRLTHELGGE